MRRALFIIVFIIGIGIIAAASLRQQAVSTSTETLVPDSLSTATPITCQLIDILGTPDLKVAMAVESLYEDIPMFKTPMAVVATPEKPFAGGCLPGE